MLAPDPDAPVEVVLELFPPPDATVEVVLEPFPPDATVEVVLEPFPPDATVEVVLELFTPPLPFPDEAVELAVAAAPVAEALWVLAATMIAVILYQDQLIIVAYRL